SLSRKLSKALNPLIKFLFPDVDKNSKAHEEISLNMIANILGLGNASTPLGLQAMETLQKQNPSKTTLSNSMAMLVLINTASLQLIPTTVIAIRTSLNSTNPTSIILPVWVATLSAAISAIIAAKIFIKLGK
ncbi:MAG: nucleoside recognition protein, partial [Clostridia bacterium]|nr:nucleoside recognition protein [Clostridia bacterium]